MAAKTSTKAMPWQGTMPWLSIEEFYLGTKRDAVAAQVTRARLLTFLRDTAPWRDRARYASASVHAEFAKMTWKQVVQDRLHENLIEVENTIKVFEVFGADYFRRFGRTALLYVYNRLSDRRQQEEALNRIRLRRRWGDRHPAKDTVLAVLNEIAPTKRRSNVVNMVAKLKAANTRLREQLATAKRDLDATKRDLDEARKQIKCPRCGRRISPAKLHAV